MKPDIALLDCLDELSQFNTALSAVVDMLAGCDDANAPPASYLWQLLAILSRYGEEVETQLQQLVATS